MHKTTLRKVGGSIMLTVPPAFIDQLHLQAGGTVGIGVSGGRLVVEPKYQPRYTMAELLAASDYSQPHSAEESEWTNGIAVGGELI